MKVLKLHSWNISPKEAVALQKSLASQVDVSKPLGEFRYVAGADVSFNRFSNIIYSGVVVLDVQTMKIVERVGAVTETCFPYCPSTSDWNCIACGTLA